MRSWLRRLLHASSPLVLLPAYWITWEAQQVLLVVLAIGALAVDLLRIRVAGVGQVFARLLPVWRPHESRRLSGAVWLAIAYAVAARAPVPAALAAIFAGAWADPAASLIGRRYGAGKRKSGAGTAAAAIVSTGVAVLVGFPLPVAVVGGTVAAALERWAVAPDDNLWLAPGVALALMSFA